MRAFIVVVLWVLCFSCGYVAFKMQQAGLETENYFYYILTFICGILLTSSLTSAFVFATSLLTRERAVVEIQSARRPVRATTRSSSSDMVDFSDLGFSRTPLIRADGKPLGPLVVAVVSGAAVIALPLLAQQAVIQGMIPKEPDGFLQGLIDVVVWGTISVGPLIGGAIVGLLLMATAGELTEQPVFGGILKFLGAIIGVGIIVLTYYFIVQHRLTT